MPSPRDLSGRVAVVAGATRGAGRGIARMLGEAGAVVYCTGRSSRVQPNTSNHVNAGRPETIEETAEMVSAAGGTGIPVRVDHTVEDEVAALFKRVGREQKRLDVLAIVMTGQPATWKTFLDESPGDGRDVRRKLDLAAHRDGVARGETHGDASIRADRGAG